MVRAAISSERAEETRGRIFGGIFAVINAAVAIPLLVAGVIADAVGVAGVVAGLGVIILAGAVVVRLAFWRRLAVLDAVPGPPH